MIRRIIAFFLFLTSTSILISSWLACPLFDYVNQCDIIIQGEISHINHYFGTITEENIGSLKDTAYVQVNIIFKNDSINEQLKTNVKLFMPTTNRITEDGIAITNCNDIFYEVGQDGIWLLVKKDDGYNANHYQAFQPNSKHKLIEELCKIKPQNLLFLQNISRSKFSDANQFLNRKEIEPKDSIFFFTETNPIFIAVKRKNVDFIQKLIDYGFDVNFNDCNNENALFIALSTFSENLKVVEILLSNGIETEITNTSGITIVDKINRNVHKNEIWELFQKYDKNERK